ncbi:MAG: radical SAM protein [Deltaproteobacteria bacterium]|jgi:tRNA A37 methylthiotransferase MiaB|nr:radical SAM protein [Deltaproteobacteria bacterium]
MDCRNFHIITLGCKVNQYESEARREAWLRAGHRETAAPEEADIVLIHSCAVTSRAVSDLRALVRRVRRQAPACRLLISGCAVRALPEEARELAADVLLDRPESPAWPDFSISSYGRSRPVLKIHDGCSRHCTYCIVPRARGPSVSRPWPGILAEAERLIQAGFREIILSGVNLLQYGEDLSPPADLWSLLDRLEHSLAPEWEGKDLRFRLSSLEPSQLDARALDFLARSRLLAPHLHLSLQSGNPRVLRRMGRGHYDPEAVLDFLRRLEDIWPVFGLGADFIAGFPGESEEQFAETLRLAQELPLSYAHVFPYSRRPGTPACDFPDQISPAVKKERAARLRRLLGEKKAAFLRRQLALPLLRAVPEESGRDRGINEFYSVCRFTSPLPEEGKSLIPVRPLRVEGETLLVEKAASPA